MRTLAILIELEVDFDDDYGDPAEIAEAVRDYIDAMPRRLIGIESVRRADQ